MIDFNVRIECALHIANVVIREDAHGDVEAGSRAFGRLMCVLEGSEYPNVALRALTRRLGRVRAAKVGVEPEVIRLALSEA